MSPDLGRKFFSMAFWRQGSGWESHRNSLEPSPWFFSIDSSISCWPFHCWLKLLIFFSWWSIFKFKSDYITSFLKILQWLPISLRVKAEHLTLAHWAHKDLPPSSLPLPPWPCPFSCSFCWGQLAYLLFIKHSRCLPASGSSTWNILPSPISPHILSKLHEGRDFSG